MASSNIRKLLGEAKAILGLNEDDMSKETPVGSMGMANVAGDAAVAAKKSDDEDDAEESDEEEKEKVKDAEKGDKAEAIRASKRTVKEDDAKKDDDEDDKEDEKKDDEAEMEEMLAEIQDFNPFAVCKAAAKKQGWSKEKTERCIKDAKGKAGAVYEAIRQAKRDIRKMISEA